MELPNKMNMDIHPTANLIRAFFKEINTDNIDNIEPCKEITFNKLMTHIPNITPCLHRQINRSIICHVKNCRNKTSNECNICLDCHPIKKSVYFPCFLSYPKEILENVLNEFHLINQKGVME